MVASSQPAARASGRRRRRSPFSGFLPWVVPVVLGLAAVGLLAAMALGGVELLAPIAIVAVVLPVLWVATIMFLDRLSHNAARHRRS